MGKKEKTVIKVVIDTNILISSILFRGELARIVDLWKRGSIVPVVSRATFDEFREVLEYPWRGRGTYGGDAVRMEGTLVLKVLFTRTHLLQVPGLWLRC